MRLTGTIYALDGRSDGLTIRVRVQGLPAGAEVTITDLMLQLGEAASGTAPNPREAGTAAGGVQYRSGVVNGEADLVILSNADRGGPVRLDLESTYGEARIGSYRFGQVDGTATVDGEAHTASRGWGRAPIITERCDLTVPASTTGRAHLRVQWTDRGTGG